MYASELSVVVSSACVELLNETDFGYGISISFISILGSSKSLRIVQI